MHELALSESVLCILENHARTDGFRRVRAVRLEIGDLAGVDKNAMRFSFEAVCKGTLAEDAELEIVDVPGTAWCPSCSKSVLIGERFQPCPNCGQFELRVTGGEDMFVKQLEVE